jgi:hypothetical protein
LAPSATKTKPVEQLDEDRDWIDLKRGAQIGIDEPHVKGQQRHAHLPSGRAVNQDGTVSHGGKPFYLTREEAKVLRQQDFTIKKSRLVESLDANMVTLEIDQRIADFLIELQAQLGTPDESFVG